MSLGHIEKRSPENLRLRRIGFLGSGFRGLRQFFIDFMVRGSVFYGSGFSVEGLGEGRAERRLGLWSYLTGAGFKEKGEGVWG